MAKKQSAESVYRIVDVVGVSEKSWEDAGRRAIETAATSLRDLRVAEVTQMDMKVEDQSDCLSHAGGAVVQIRRLKLAGSRAGRGPHPHPPDIIVASVRPGGSGAALACAQATRRRAG